LGFVLSAQGVETDPEKINTIVGCPFPKLSMKYEVSMDWPPFIGDIFAISAAL